jgi:Fibronectin type III domain
VGVVAGIVGLSGLVWSPGVAMAVPARPAIAPVFGQTSLTWAGYQDPASGIEGVMGSWTEGNGNASQDSLATSWIGVGTSGNVLEVGTETGPGGGDWAFYQTPGQPPVTIPGTVQEGDTINAVVEEGSTPWDWVVEIGDPTEGWGFDQPVQYTEGATTGAEWIVSNPNPPAVPVSDFGAVTFRATQVAVNMPGMAPGNPVFEPSTLTADDAVTMVNPAVTHVLGQPSLILPYPGGQQFTDQYVSEPYAPLNLHAARSGSRAVQLRWSLPVFDGGEPFAYYTITVYRDGRDYRTLNTPNDLPFYLVDGLSSRHSYRFAVAANNTGGWQGPATGLTRAVRG